jgi:cytosine/adenosine deaminase-related metal-dependent hydrolase
MDARGKLVMPGLNIAHAHSWGNLFKGLFDGKPLDIWILENNAPPDGWPFNSRQYYLRTMLGCADMIRSGATTVWDDLVITPDHNETIFKAYQESGMRAVLAASMYDRAFPDRNIRIKQQLPQDLLKLLMKEPVYSPDEWLDIAESMVAKWHNLDGRLVFSSSIAWPQGASDDLIMRAFEFAEKHDLAFLTHALETKAQQVLGQVFYKKSIIAHLNDLGVLGARSTIVHGIWITDADMRLLGDAHASVIHNPSSNMLLGSGRMPYRELLNAGVNIALGVDEGYQTKWNPFEMMRLSALLHKVSTPDTSQWPTSLEILKIATRGSARSENLHQQTGQLTPGYKADLILLDCSSPTLSPLNNLTNQLVYHEDGSSVCTSIINGNVVMQDRKLLTMDMDAMLTEARESMPAYWTAQLARDPLALSRKVIPLMEAVYRSAVATPTGINRWLEDERAWIENN